jgi:hypothetical protein
MRPQSPYTVAFLGATGFDVGRETFRCMPRCRLPRETICKSIVANDDNYALAA